MKDLWPKDFVSILKSPTSLQAIDSQAKALGKHTSNIVTARLKQLRTVYLEDYSGDYPSDEQKDCFDKDTLYFGFYVGSSCLRNYETQLLTISCKYSGYPLTISFKDGAQTQVIIKDENELERKLSEVLNSEYVLSAIGFILSHAQYG